MAYIFVVEMSEQSAFVFQMHYFCLCVSCFRCQRVFIAQLNLEENIARNQALCENVFMMVICIELRIPLFVVGKPGSSKSLAKTIVQDNMQGNLSKSNFFKHFKQVSFVLERSKDLLLLFFVDIFKNQLDES